MRVVQCSAVAKSKRDAGCIDKVSGSGDLSAVTTPVTILADGGYTLTSDDHTAGFELGHDASGKYHYEPIGGKPGEGNGDFKLFGPINGLYVLETFAPETGSVDGFTVWELRENGDFAAVGEKYGDPLQLGPMLADQLFTQLGAHKSGIELVTALTDNAALNWAILQRLIVTRGGELKFQDFIRRGEVNE